MAVLLKSEVQYLKTLLPMFSVPTALCEKAASLGISVAQPSLGVFVVKGSDGTTYGTVQIKSNAITLAKKGQLGPSSKEALRFQFEKILQKAVAACSSVEAAPLLEALKALPENTSPPMAQGEVPNYASTKDSIGSKFDYTAPVQISGYGASAIANQPKKPSPSVIQLKDAKVVLQHVKGTSQSSVYTVAALFTGCNMAIRLSSSQLSVRFEGPSLSSYSAALESVGVDIKGDYASVHYSIASTDTALLTKTLGAIIATMGFAALQDVAPLGSLLGGS